MHFLKKKVQSFTTVIRGSSVSRGGDVSSRTDWLLEKSICIIVYCDSPRGEQCRVANWELSRVIKTHQTHHITWYQLKWLIPWFITLGSDFTGCSSGTTRSTCVFVSHYWVRGKHANTNKKKQLRFRQHWVTLRCKGNSSLYLFLHTNTPTHCLTAVITQFKYKNIIQMNKVKKKPKKQGALWERSF